MKTKRHFGVRNLDSLDFIFPSVIIVLAYLRRPPPPPPPRDPPLREEPPMLEEPRELLARAPLPLMPDDAPPKALLFVALPEFGTCRLPTRSPPPPRLELPAPAPRLGVSRVPAPRSPPEPRLDVSRLPAPRSPPGCCRLSLPPRSPPAGCCLAWFWRAFACRFDSESPRVVPPNLSAVDLSEYGAPPRCCGLCCQLLLPLAGWLAGRLPRFALLMFCRLLLLTKLLLLLMVTLLFPPHPHPPPAPPLQKAPIATPTPNDMARPAA